MKKNVVKINENTLRQIIAESVKKVLKEGEDYGDIDFSRTNGVRLPSDGDGYYFSPKETKEAIRNLQNALKKVMDMLNGNAMGDDLSNELWDQCYSFYQFINQYYIELDDECRDFKGTWKQNSSNVPFIRKYTDDFSIPPYYSKNGEPIDDKSRFGSDFQPHKK